MVLVSTHRLELAGRLRDAFAGEGYAVDLMPSVEHLDLADDPLLLVLTGAEGASAWTSAGRERLGVPVLAVAETREGLRALRAAGAETVFTGEIDAQEVALQGHRTMERRRLQATTGIIGESESIVEVLERVVQIAPFPSTVLITGESGTGKELVARGIHQLSPRRSRAFLGVNVAAVSETLLESELFGHEKGAFTGAIDSRRGFFELAHRGSLFLDEIGEMPLQTQTKLLRVLEQREFLRVGGEQPIEVDVRIIAATNRDLREQVAVGEFRRDLYYRLNILQVELPPLRERRHDIPVLVRHFTDELSRRMDRPFPGITDEAMQLLVDYDWPGNIRELRNLVESMVVLSPGREIRPDDIPREIRLPRAMNRLLPPPANTAGGGGSGTVTSPVPLPVEGPPAPARDAAATDLRPQLEFVFRTLVDLRVDMDELRREFELYREEVDDRLEDGPEGWALPPVAAGIEIAAVEPPTTGEGSAEGHEERVGDEGAIRFQAGMTMDELEEEAIRVVLREVDGNRRRAAESLGIGERTLYRKIRKYGIEV